MVIDAIRKLVSDKQPTPNKFTIAMGDLIRKAREEAGLSQVKLSRMIYRRQATLSDMENGKVEVSTGTLALLAATLDKPLTYFFPRFLYTRLKPENLSPLEEELIIFFRQLSDEEVKKIAIHQIKALSKLDSN